MVSKKSKKAKRRNKPPRFSLMDRVAKKGFLQGRKVVFQPSGEVKMSEVLLEFVEPYKQFAQTEEAYRKMLTLAVVAWNASFLPEREQKNMVDKVIGAASSDKELNEGLKGIVKTMIERKRLYFSEYTRQIIDFEVSDTGESFHVSVVSFL